MTTEADSVLILHNPRSGARHAKDVIDAHVHRLSRAGFQVEAVDSLDRLAAQSQSLQRENRLRAVIAAGGDGTASAVASRVEPSTPLWLCPLGTENLLARYCRMTNDPDQAAAAIRKLETRSMDAGLVNGKLFLIMVSAGYDAEVVRQVHTNRRGHIRKWHYWWPILKSVFSYRFPKFQIACDGSQAAEQATWLFAMNVPRYADGLSIAPTAIDDDGRIDVCTFKHGGLFRGLDYLLSVRRSRHTRHPDFRHLKAASVRVEPVSDKLPPIPFQLDGDFGGFLPITLEVQPNRLKLVVPAS